MKTVIILDKARYNYAKATRAFAEENGIFLLFLPPYAPNLNSIERLWKLAKKHLINNKYHEQFNHFFDATDRFFNNLNKHHQELTSLMTRKFQIIHVEQYNMKNFGKCPARSSEISFHIPKSASLETAVSYRQCLPVGCLSKNIPSQIECKTPVLAYPSLSLSIFTADYQLLFPRVIISYHYLG